MGLPFHILGAGSIGCLFAHHLSRAGWPVTLLLRPEALAAFERAGRAVRCGDAAAACGAEPVGVGPASSSAASFAGGAGASPIHNLLVTTKASQTAAAVASVADRLAPDSVIVLLQNGVLGVHEDLRSSLPFSDPARRPSFLLGSTTHGAWRRAPFDVVWHEGTAVFGRPINGAAANSNSKSSGNTSSSSSSGGEGGRAAEVLGALGGLELAPLWIDATLSPEQLHQQLLVKLLVNACVNPLTALLHCRNGGLLANAPAGRLLSSLVAECRAALGSSTDGQSSSSSGSSSVGGLVGSQEELVARVEQVVAATAGNVNSMLQDVIKGGPTEIDYINGYVVRCAEARGVPVPLNTALLELVRAREACAPEYTTHEEMR